MGGEGDGAPLPCCTPDTMGQQQGWDPAWQGTGVWRVWFVFSEASSWREGKQMAV